MDSALIDVLRERERLLARIEQQRSAVAVSVAGLATPLALVDRAVGVCRYLRAHPLAAGVMVAAIVALRARLALRWLVRGLGLWRMGRQLRSLVQRLGI